MTTGFAFAQLAVKLPPVAAVAVSGWCAVEQRPWYVWVAFLVAALILDQTLVQKRM